MTAFDLTGLLTSDLTDITNRLVLADALEDIGRDQEAGFCRDLAREIDMDRNGSEETVNLIAYRVRAIGIVYADSRQRVRYLIGLSPEAFFDKDTLYTAFHTRIAAEAAVAEDYIGPDPSGRYDCEWQIRREFEIPF